MRAMEQLPLDFTFDERGLKGFFESILKKPVHLVLTNNCARMLSVKSNGDGVALRISRVFLSAPLEVLNDAASFIRKRGGRAPLVTKFLRSNPAPVRKTRKTKARTKGRHHDLGPVFESVNREYFNGSIEAGITWSRRQRGRVRRRTLGSYCSRSRMVRINPVLDNPGIPLLFIEYIVYHEMLHAALPAIEKGGRRLVHSREFREKEKEFKGFKEALAWEKANVALL